MPGFHTFRFLLLSTAQLLAIVAFAAMLIPVTVSSPAQAQANFDRPGGDYAHSEVLSGDPAACALACERDRRCRSWSFNYPTAKRDSAICWMKSSVPRRYADPCCVSGVRGAGVVELRNRKLEIAAQSLIHNSEPTRLRRIS